MQMRCRLAALTAVLVLAGAGAAAPNPKLAASKPSPSPTPTAPLQTRSGEPAAGRHLALRPLTGMFGGLTGRLQLTVQVTDAYGAVATLAPKFWMLQHTRSGAAPATISGSRPAASRSSAWAATATLRSGWTGGPATIAAMVRFRPLRTAADFRHGEWGTPERDDRPRGKRPPVPERYLHDQRHRPGPVRLEHLLRLGGRVVESRQSVVKA